MNLVMSNLTYSVSKINIDKIKYMNDVWHKWTHKSDDVPFDTNTKCVGGGEEKLAKELNITTGLGGQNSTIDLVHHELGNISVKDMTDDSCILGTDGCQNMRRVFRQTIYPLISWCEKYRINCKYAEDTYNQLNKNYGRARISIFDGIERFELCASNFNKLDLILQSIKKDQQKIDIKSLKSEYIIDICKYMKDQSLYEMINANVKKEAIDKTLIIVHKKKGWMIVKDLDKIMCSRITRGAPRIAVNL